MKDSWQSKLKNAITEHITASHIICLLICLVAYFSFGQTSHLPVLYSINGIGAILLVLVYWAVTRYISVNLFTGRSFNMVELLYILLTFVLILAVVLVSGNINSPVKVLMLIPVIILSITRGKLAGMTAATAVGLYLLIASLFSGYYGNPNKVFEANLIFTGVALLVGWLVGGFTDIEMEARKHLSDLNEELEQKVADRTNELAAINRELENEIAERRQIEYELKAQNRIYDAMHCVLEEASAVSVPRYEEISSLAELAFSLQSVGYEHNVAARLVEVACEIAGAKQGCYYGYDENTGRLNLVYTVGLPGDMASRSGEVCMFVKGEERGFVGLVAQTKKPVYVPDVQADPRWIEVDFARHIRSCYLLPFYHGEKLFGVFVLLSEHVDGFSREKRVLADTLASYISTAMENARLFTEVHRAYERLNLTQQQLFQSQKMEAVGQLAGGMAHDLNNQLTIIQACVDLYLKSVPENDPIYKAFLRIRHAAERSANLTRQLMLFARKHPQFLEPLDLNSNIRELQEMFKQMIGEDITIELDLYDGLWIVNADAGNIDQVITNLVLNARDAMPQGGRITIKTENVMIEEGCSGTPQEGRPGCFVRLTVEDTGTGMDKQILSHIFEPFFTTKDPGKGTGLGLSVAYGIVKDHDGWINVKSKVGQGTVFEIYLPAVATGTPPDGNKGSRLSPGELYGTGEKILLVEDDYEVMLLTSRILSENGYTVVSCSKACEALQIFEKEKDFSLVISDVILTDGSGIDIIRQLRTSHPSLGGLLISGYSDERSNLQRIPRGEFHFLSKPYLAIDLLRNVREILNQNQ